MKSILSLILLSSLLFVPTISFAQGGVVPDCNGGPCGYTDLILLVKNIINWLIITAIPISAGVFAWAGFIYMTSGIADRKSEAKEMIRKVFIGLVIILSAWIIVTTITNTLLDPSFKSAVPLG